MCIRDSPQKTFIDWGGKVIVIEDPGLKFKAYLCFVRIGKAAVVEHRAGEFGLPHESLGEAGEVRFAETRCV